MDSDFAGDVNKRSLIGYIYTLSSCAIRWKTTIQSTIYLSTTEAKYRTMTEGVKEIILLRGFDLRSRLHQGVTTLFCVSQSAIHLT